MIAWLPAYIVGAAAWADPETIRRVADEVVARPEFQLEPKADPMASLWAWLVALLISIVGPVFRFFGNLWTISPVLAVIVIVLLCIVLVALIWHIIYSFRQAMQLRSQRGELGNLANRQLDPRGLELAAEEAAHHHDYIGAVRLLFRACVARLDERERRATRPGITNREYLRRHQGTSNHALLSQFVEIIDAKWYGFGTCDLHDYQRCHQALTQLTSAAGGQQHAHGA